MARTFGAAALVPALLFSVITADSADAQGSCADAAATATVRDAYKWVPATPAPAAPSPTATPKQDAPPTAPSKPPEKIKTVELKDTISVEIDNLAKLYDKACQNKNLVLYLDGLPLRSLTPYPPTDPAGGKLLFELRRTESSRTAWIAILGQPFSKNPAVEVSVGFEDQFPLKPSGARLPSLLLDRTPLIWIGIWGYAFRRRARDVRMVRETNQHHPGRKSA